jgi:hypothetical protein
VPVPEPGVFGFAAPASIAAPLLDAVGLAPAAFVFVVAAPPFSGAAPGAAASDRAEAGGVVPGDDGLGDGALPEVTPGEDAPAAGAFADGELGDGAFAGGALAGGELGAGAACGGAVDGFFFSSEGR